MKDFTVHTDPAHFAAQILSAPLWRRQRDITRAVVRKRHVAVKACHASGKTYAAATLVPFWLQRFPGGKVITTAPTMRQVKLLWEEVRGLITKSKMRFPMPSTTALRISDREYAMGISSAHGVNAQGFHGEKVLIIADEAPGIDEEIWDAMEGIRLGGDVHLAEFGNPVVPSGHFFDNFATGRSTCECLTISAFDTPNLQNLETGLPYTIEELAAMNDDQLSDSPSTFLVSRRGVLERFRRWGPTNPKYIARVLGDFPSRSDFCVFDVAWIERAKRTPTDAELSAAKGSYIQVGIDVAGAGEDETTAAARVDGILIDRMAWDFPDPRGPVVAWLSRFRKHPLYKLGPVIVDITGIGYNFALHLADQGFQVYGFNAAATPMDKKQFVNLKSEIYWTSRDYFQDNLVSGLGDEETEAQLAGVMFATTSRGLTYVESKDDAKARGQASPDRAEALIMAFMQLIPEHQMLTTDYRVVTGGY